MRTLTRWIVVLAISTFAIQATAQSQARPKPKGVQPVEDIASPPDVKDFNPAKDIKVTTRQSGTDTIEEFRIGGKLYQQRIQPASGPAYYLVDEKGEGKFIRVDGPDLKIAVPTWVLFTWK